MKDGLRNCNAMYKPEMISVSTTCMAEVIGDDLGAFIIGAKDEAEGELDNVLIPNAHTPSFVGSHITGYDNMMKSILEQVSTEKTTVDEERINIIPGFEPYLGSLKEIKKTPNIKKIDADFDKYNIAPNKYDLIVNINYFLQSSFAARISSALLMVAVVSSLYIISTG